MNDKRRQSAERLAARSIKDLRTTLCISEREALNLKIQAIRLLAQDTLRPEGPADALCCSALA